MNISYLGGGKGRAQALWGCLLYLMWKLLPWFWSWGNRGTSCDNVCYLIWHLWHTLDSFYWHRAAVNRFDCGALPWWRSAGILVLLTKTRLFFAIAFSLFFLPVKAQPFVSPSLNHMCVERDCSVWKLICVRRSIQTAWNRHLLLNA